MVEHGVPDLVAIGKSLEARMGERRGRPSKAKNVENFPQFKGNKTRELAATKAGFGNDRTYAHGLNQFKSVEFNRLSGTVHARTDATVSLSVRWVPVGSRTRATVAHPADNP